MYVTAALLASLILAMINLYFSSALLGSFETSLISNAATIGLYCWFVFAGFMVAPYNTNFAALGVLGAFVTALLI